MNKLIQSDLIIKSLLTWDVKVEKRIKVRKIGMVRMMHFMFSTSSSAKLPPQLTFAASSHLVGLLI